MYATPPRSDTSKRLSRTPSPLLPSVVVATPPSVSQQKTISKTSKAKIDQVVAAVCAAYTRPALVSIQISRSGFEAAWKILLSESYSKLRGFIDDKLRCEYDIVTRTFRIYMGLGFLHEYAVVVLRKIVDRYLESARATHDAAVSTIAKSIKDSGSAIVKSLQKKDPTWLSELAGASDSSPAQVLSNSTSPSPRRLRSRAARSQKAHEPALEGSPVSSESSEVPVGLSPDAGWLFNNSHYSCRSLGVVVEIAKTEGFDHLRAKAASLILHYDVNVVLGVVFDFFTTDKDIAFEKGTTVLTIWSGKGCGSEREVEHTVFKVLLDPAGEIQHFLGDEVKLCSIDDFLSAETMTQMWLEDNSNAEKLEEYPYLVLSLQELARALLNEREESSVAEARMAIKDQNPVDLEATRQYLEGRDARKRKRDNRSPSDEASTTRRGYTQPGKARRPD